jgi:alpha-galactosidase
MRILALMLLLLQFGPTPKPVAIHRAAGFDIQVIGNLDGFSLRPDVRKLEDGLEILHLTLTSTEARTPPRFTLKWSLPSHDVAGHWMTSRGQQKTIRPDWAGSRMQASMLSREAPVSTLFSSDNKNVLTFAVSDGLNTISVGSGVREEDGFIYSEVVFFAERHKQLREYVTEVRLDRRSIPYEAALRGVADWWAQQPGYEPASTPDVARRPVYSTWYNYHQSVSSAELLKELAIAKPLGFDSIIVDDGWQTLDSGRGYAFTGDWKPERMPDMKNFVDASHALGVKVILWYAVPFVGKNASAAARFKDKSLRLDDRLGAYVVDPRYPEVRQYLIDIYRNAIRDWGIDGFKLDFIERFVADDQTVLDATNGRDYASVNEATDRLMTDVMAELRKIKPDVMIEFRQAYIGPLMRKYGNMFRASDSPNAYLANRVKVVDLRLLSGTTTVHADMIMWHESEPVEAAAFQFLNILFSVPQVSVRFRQVPKDHLQMIKFYTSYWNDNRAVLLDAPIEAPYPLANYPLVRARAAGKEIVALYSDLVVRLDPATAQPTASAKATEVKRIDIVNAKNSTSVVVAANGSLGTYRFETRNCLGTPGKSGQVRLSGLMEFNVPVSGLISFERIQ